MNGFTEFVLHDTLQRIKDQSWVALHFDDPGLSGAYASELSGGGYGRILAVFGDIASKHMWLSQDVTFSGLPLSMITYIAGWDAEHRGNLQWACQLLPPQRVLEGKGITIQAETVALSFG